MLTIAVIMGLGQSADGDLLGLRSFLMGILPAYPGVTFIPFEHDLPDLHAQILQLPDDVMVVGHSNGGEEASRIDRMYADNAHTLAGLMLLDAKPKWDSIVQVIDWLNPGYAYPVPRSTGRFHAFYSGFGRPFELGTNSTKLAIGHSDFPSNPTVHAMLEEWIRNWCHEEAT